MEGRPRHGGGREFGAIPGVEDRSASTLRIVIRLFRCVPERVGDDASGGLWEWVMTGVAPGHINGLGTAFKVRRFG